VPAHAPHCATQRNQLLCEGIKDMVWCSCQTAATQEAKNGEHTCRWQQTFGAQDSKAAHCRAVTVTTCMLRGRRCRRSAVIAALLMHVGLTATPAGRKAGIWLTRRAVVIEDAAVFAAEQA